jgi:hypothetical protein
MPLTADSLKFKRQCSHVTVGNAWHHRNTGFQLRVAPNFVPLGDIRLADGQNCDSLCAAARASQPVPCMLPLCVVRKETNMRTQNILLVAALGLLGACAERDVPVAAAPPPPPGAVAGSMAADRDGDGLVDGYYTADGIYHPNVAPAPAPAPVLYSRRGERS